LAAVVMTETIQAIVLIAGATVITAFAYAKVGGWDQMVATLQDSGEMVRLSMLRSPDVEKEIPWYAVFLGYPVLGIWYWCADQTIVQRVLGAKNENHARIGPLFAGFLKILPVFIFVLPGTLCLASILQQNIPALPLDKQGNPDTLQTYVHMIKHWLPLGLRGIVIAALLAALMSTVSGALNSIATLFSYDLVKRWRPEVSDRSLVRIGRAVTLAAMVAAILWSPWLEHYQSVFDGINKMIGYVAPPVTALFLWGVFWRRASATAALATAWAGTLLGVACCVFEWCGGFQWLKETVGIDVPFMLVPVFLFVVCSAILVVVSLARPESLSPEGEGLVWKKPWDALRGPWRGLGDFRLIAAALCAAMIGLYWWFD
jgi:SSS family solute:Na+ symporter